jgi:hypothetical protein
MSSDGVFSEPSVQLRAESIIEKYSRVRTYLYFSFSRGGRFMYIVHKDVLRLCLVHCKLRAGENLLVHECRNWERGRAVSFLGIHKLYFRYSVLHPISQSKGFAVTTTHSSPLPTFVSWLFTSTFWQLWYLPETTSIWTGIYLRLW